MAKPTLILDAMGADLGSAEVVRGAMDAVSATQARPFHLVLVTAEDEQTEANYRRQLEDSCDGTGCTVEILHAAEELPKAIESPEKAYRRFPECSVNVAMRRAQDCEQCSVISPGTTGLVMTSALFKLGRVRGIDRTPIGTPLPTLGKELFFVDGGSNVDCKAHWLYQFAVLAHLYERHVNGVDNPSIALLSNGSEEYKGNALVREAYQLLKADKDLNFVGYIEGHEIFHGHLDVMVCDGFIGNVLLKAVEGAAESLIEVIRGEFKRDILAGIAARLFQRPALRRVRQRLSFEQFGGAPLLGLNGNVVICHGRSTRRAIANALGVGYRLAQSDIAAKVAQYVATHESMRARNADVQNATPAVTAG